MKHCSAIYNDLRGIKCTGDIHSVELRKLSPMTWYDATGWFWNDFSKILNTGLQYPLLYYKLSPTFWQGKFATKASANAESWCKVNMPVINSDRMIWAIPQLSHNGNILTSNDDCNRKRALEFMGYTTVDAIEFADYGELVNTAMKFHGELTDV